MLKRLNELRRDPLAFVWFYWTGLLCKVFGHQEYDMLGVMPLMSEGRLIAFCRRCGDNKQSDGRWRGRV